VGIRHLTTASVVLVAAAVAGCGSATTSNSTATENKPTIAFHSPALNARGFIPSSIRCSEGKIWLPLRWGTLPVDTKELAIYVARFGKPEGVPGGTARAALLAQQLILGLKPTLHGLAVGKLPQGALIGRYETGPNKGASICPPQGSTQEGVLFRLYVLPHRQEIGKGPQGNELLSKLSSEAVAVGAFTAGYS
jgi:phosphatidylethanolamine-binding protein (PEBP) family uncharacterized protein